MNNDTRIIECNVKFCQPGHQGSQGGTLRLHLRFSSMKMALKGKQGWQCSRCRNVKWLPADA